MECYISVSQSSSSTLSADNLRYLQFTHTYHNFIIFTDTGCNEIFVPSLDKHKHSVTL